MKYELIVNASMEDGSEKTEFYDVTEENIPMIRRVAAVLGKQKQANWCPRYELCDGIDPDEYVDKDLISREDIDAFDKFVPSGGNYWCVNINSIELSPVVEKEQLL